MQQGRQIVRWYVPGTVKVTADGNSITEGNQDGPNSVGGTMGQLFRATYPFTSQERQNVAIGGQTVDQLIANTADVEAAFNPAKVNILFAQDGTNGMDYSAQVNFDKFMSYLAARRASKAWSAIVVATAPPAYLGDAAAQSVTDEWNARLEVFNGLLRTRWKEQADMLIETRAAGSPYDQARYPDYLRSTFFSDTAINGISNNASWTNEGTQIRIHYSAAGIALLAPFYANALLRCPIRVRP